MRCELVSLKFTTTIKIFRNFKINDLKRVKQCFSNRCVVRLWGGVMPIIFLLFDLL